MDKVDHFQKMVVDLGDVADFVTVYLKEAHPVDGWVVHNGTQTQIYQHKNLKERIESATILKEAGSKCPVVVDSMENKAVHVYGAFPEALFVIHDGVVKFKAAGAFAYNPKKAREWLEEYLNKQK